MKITSFAVAVVTALFATVAYAGGGSAIGDIGPSFDVPPQYTCTDPALYEKRITDQLALEPNRPHLVVTGEELERFKQNMKYAFDIDVQADKVYFIQAITRTARPGVHLFTVLDGCITYWTVTDASLMASLLNRDPASWPKSPKPDEPPVKLPPANVEVEVEIPGLPFDD